MNSRSIHCEVCGGWVMPGQECASPLHERRALANQLIEDGVTDPATLAAELGVSGRQALRYIRAAGVREETRVAPVTPITPELDARIRALLEDRAGYHETSKTTGIPEARLARRYPGYALTPAEMAERMVIGRKFSAII